MKNEETIFAAALGQTSAAERAAYLEQACAGDAGLRRAVDALLLAHDKAAGILEAAPATLQATSQPRSGERVGSTIGPYKLLEQIGGGGMGVVFMAEQLRPVRRKVALKIIKPGMDSGQVIARFEAERQALALMDHPNIAKVFDAGVTDAGRPYFVMELVKGIPITDYCDQARLDTRQRLELFIPVCQAVQHAHQKGVIHRDLKPSNVLVTMHDDKPVPKVIDFGIAKAAGQILTDKTLFTNVAQLLGTPLYMSPEQAQISGMDVDTRSDIYSLGVLLYELLTGTTPFDKQRLREAAYDEMRRIIREEDPPNPSTRLSTMGEQIASVSALRHTEPKKLGQILRGELDWISMKALEKDRTRRYETAAGFARDVQRYLNDEAVNACPPSAVYRFRKFGRRNRAALAAVGAGVSGVLLLLVLTVVSNVKISRALEEKDAALATARSSEEAAKLSATAAKEQEHKAVVERVRAEGYFLRLRTVVDGMVKRLETTDVAHLPQVEKLRSELVRDVLSYYDELLNRAATQPADLYATARAYRMTGDLRALVNERDRAEADMRSGIEILDKLVEQFPDDKDSRHVLAATNSTLGKFLHEGKRFDEAEKAFRRAIGIWSKLALSFPTAAHYRSSIINTHGLLFKLLKEHGDPGEAEQAYREIVVSFEKDAADAPGDLARQAALVHAWRLAGDVLGGSKRPTDAQEAYALSIAVCAKLAAAAPRDVAERLLVADALTASGELDRALEEYGKAAAHRTAETSSELQTNLAAGLSRLAKVLKQTDQAVRAYGLAIEIRQPLLGKATPQLRLAQASDYNEMAWRLGTLKRVPEAEKAVRAGLHLKQALAAEFPDNLDYPMHIVHSLLGLGHIARDAGRTADAAAAYGNAAKTLDEVSARDPKTSESLPKWRAHTFWDLSNAWHSLKRLKEAERAAIAAMTVFQSLAAKYPSNPFYRQEQAFTHRLLAGVAQSASRTTDAYRHDAEAFDMYKLLVGEAKDATFYCGEMMYAAEKLKQRLEQANPAERETNAARTQAVLLEADQALTRAITKQPETPALLKMHAQLLEWRGKEDQALETLNKLLSVQPELATTWAARGWLRDKRREWDQSETDFTKVIELAPRTWEGWSGRAFSHFHRQHWQAAVADFSKSLELDPGMHMNWHHRGLAHIFLGQWQSAIGDFTRITERWPDNRWGWFHRAESYAQLNRRPEAIADLRQAVSKGVDADTLKNADKLDPIRGEEGFKTLLVELDNKRN